MSLTVLLAMLLAMTLLTIALRATWIALLAAWVALLAAGVAVLATRGMTVLGAARMNWRGCICRTTGQVDVDSSLVGFSVVLQAQLLTDPLHPRLDLLNMVRAVISFADDDMEMCLSCGLRVFDAFFKDILRLFDELPVQVYGVGGDAPFGIVLAKDELGGLFVVGLHLGAMLLPFF